MTAGGGYAGKAGVMAHHFRVMGVCPNCGGKAIYNALSGTTGCKRCKKRRIRSGFGGWG